MKRIIYFACFYSAVLLMAVPGCLCLTSCSDAMPEEDVFGDEDIIKLNVTFDKADATTRFWAPTTVSEVFINAYSGSVTKAKDLRFAPNDKDEWVSTKKLSWPAKDGLISLYGLTSSFTPTNNPNLYAESMLAERSFTVAVPTSNADDLWFGSTLNTNKTLSGGTVNMNFNRLLSLVNLQCNNSMQYNTVTVQKVILHNLVSAGKFKYHESISGRGEFTLLNEKTNPQDPDYGQWADYTYDMTANPLSIAPVSKLTFSGGVSNAKTGIQGLVLMPQKTTMWVTGTDPNYNSISDANGNCECYVELVCKIVDTNNMYVWGAAGPGETYSEWESVYIPLNKTWKQGRTVTIAFDMADARNANGSPFKGHEGNQIVFNDNFRINLGDSDDGCDDWELDIQENENYWITF